MSRTPDHHARAEAFASTAKRAKVFWRAMASASCRTVALPPSSDEDQRADEPGC